MTKNNDQKDYPPEEKAWMLWNDISELTADIWQFYEFYFIQRVLDDDIPLINPYNDSIQIP